MIPLLLSLLANPAQAGGWDDFADAFPSLPCADGWAGCIVGSTTVSPEPVPSSDGVPTPADQRVAWFSLDSQPAFDPFAGLSTYRDTGPRPLLPEVIDLPGTKPPPIEPPPVGPDINPPPPPPIEPPVRRIIPDKPPQLPQPPKPAALGSDPTQLADCGDRNKNEREAMMGKLSDDASGCLETLADSAPSMTTRGKASRVLMAHAHATRDTAGWERLTRRHLDDIDRSDPDIALRYALHLSRNHRDASAILKWTDVANENRHLWTGPAYVRNTTKLRSLAARAAGKRWQSLEVAKADGKEVSEKDRERWRLETVTRSREWYDYASSAGGKTDKALALCISAAGTQDACR